MKGRTNRRGVQDAAAVLLACLLLAGPAAAGGEAKLGDAGAALRSAREAASAAPAPDGVRLETWQGTCGIVEGVDTECGDFWTLRMRHALGGRSSVVLDVEALLRYDRYARATPGVELPAVGLAQPWGSAPLGRVEWNRARLFAELEWRGIGAIAHEACVDNWGGGEQWTRIEFFTIQLHYDGTYKRMDPSTPPGICSAGVAGRAGVTSQGSCSQATTIPAPSPQELDRPAGVERAREN